MINQLQKCAINFASLDSGLPKNMSITARPVLHASVQILLLLKCVAASDEIFQLPVFYCIYRRSARLIGDPFFSQTNLQDTLQNTLHLNAQVLSFSNFKTLFAMQHNAVAWLELAQLEGAPAPAPLINLLRSS